MKKYVSVFKMLKMLLEIAYQTDPYILQKLLRLCEPKVKNLLKSGFLEPIANT